MVDRAAWSGALRGMRPWRGTRLALAAPLERSKGGGSGSFLGLASDGNRYWIKTLNSPQGTRVAINEQIVGRVAQLIGAPTCAVEVIFVPADLEGWEFRDGRPLLRGFAHASRAIEPVVEERSSLRHRNMDENAVRHAGCYALYDWSWGGDVQNLTALTDENRFYSHDHGHFFPAGPNWTAETLRANVNRPNELAVDGGGLDFIEVQRLAQRLDVITMNELARALSAIPRGWPVTDEELEEMGYFLESRAQPTAVRLRARFGGGV